MNASLERATGGATVNRAEPDKVGNRIIATSLGEGFEFAFALCVLLGALWLLASGYA